MPKIQEMAHKKSVYKDFRMVNKLKKVELVNT